MPFRSSDVMRRGALVPALAGALRAADIVSPRQLGKLLARCEGTIADGVRLDRGRLTAGGVLLAERTGVAGVISRRTGGATLTAMRDIDIPTLADLNRKDAREAGARRDAVR